LDGDDWLAHIFLAQREMRRKQAGESENRSEKTKGSRKWFLHDTQSNLLSSDGSTLEASAETLATE
jgi:hypothetical protein